MHRVFVWMQCVPMGFIGAVDVMQCFARRFVFNLCGVSPKAEMKKDQKLPEGEIAIVCLDGFDFIRKINVMGDGLKEGWDSE